MLSLRLPHHLHSTMYLLNRDGERCTYKRRSFTFHYVSIKSYHGGRKHFTKHEFTFHYVSIKSVALSARFNLFKNLHSTMYLLNPSGLLNSSCANSIYIPLCIY